ncbi:MAG: hypothetical protein WBW88_17185 [Rhodothermales bacterium]
MKATHFILIAVWLVPTALTGQGLDQADKNRVSIVLSLGATVGGPASGLADQLRLAGYDDGSPGCFFSSCGTLPHPSKQSPTIASGVTLRYPVSHALIVGGGLATSDLGGAIGYKESGFEFIFSDWTTSILWAGAFWTAYPGVRVGGGPAWYRLHSHETLEENKISRLGMMGEAGLEFPSNRLFFVDVAVRINVVPEEDVQYHNFDRETIASLRPKWTHMQVLAGFGVHL